MKVVKVKSFKLLILTIAFLIALSTVVHAQDFLVGVQSNSTGNQTGNTSDSAQEIAPVPVTFTTVNQTVYALRNTNIKESYSATSATISSLTKDSSITRTGVSETSGWSRVQTTDGKIGYIQSSDLTTTAPTPTTPQPVTPTTPTFTTVNQTVYVTKNTNVKESYSTTSTTLTTLTKDSSVTRTGISETTGWSRVRLANGTVGYILSSDLTTTAPSVSLNEKEGSLPQTGIEDNPMLLVVLGVSIITAVVAFKKIKEYNV